VSGLQEDAGQAISAEVDAARGTIEDGMLRGEDGGLAIQEHPGQFTAED
jgi:hypothetical protein